MTNDTSDISFILPGEWWRIRLTDEAAVDQQTQALVNKVIGKADQYAQVRRDLKSKIAEAARVAWRASATDFYFALEIVPGVPIPVSMSVYAADVPLGLSREASARAGADSLAASLARVDPAQKFEVSGDEHTAVLRGHKTITGPLLAETGGEGASDLVVSYWLLSKASPQVPLLSFTSPFVSLEENMLDLFDAIVSTVSGDPGGSLGTAED